MPPGGTPPGTARHHRSQPYLLVHHRSEDDAPWPVLRARVAGQPGRVALVEALEAEHAAIGPLLAAIDAAAADPDHGYQRFGAIMIGE
jgi:hypothetical protein